MGAKVSDGVPCSQMPWPLRPAACPTVRVVDREGAAAVEIAQLLSRQAGRDMVTPTGVFLSPSPGSCRRPACRG